MSFYVTGGTLQSDAPSYVERDADHQLYAGLLDGEFCYVLTARQMGKSSLMVRTANRLRAADVHVVVLDLTALGGQNITPEQWYFGLLDTLGVALGLQEDLEKFWEDYRELGPLHRFMRSIRQIVLPRLRDGGITPGLWPADAKKADSAPEPSATRSSDDRRPSDSGVRLVIFVDEIDFVRSLPFSTDEFFAAIRECYNHRTIDSTYEMLTFCLLGVASPSDLIRDTRTTPFNIGRRIELNDFTSEEAAPLVQGLKELNIGQRDSRLLLDRILYWTEGHPYLTQRLCRATAESLRSLKGQTAFKSGSHAALVDRLCADLYFCTRARERDDNLIFVRERLLRNDVDRSSLLDLYLRVWQDKRVMDDEFDPLISLLNLSGVVRLQDGRLRERNRIYGRVFDDEWVRSNLPKAELRRQRDAYLRGVVRASLVTVIVLATFGYLAVTVINERKDTRIAEAQRILSVARELRLSGDAGQRTRSLETISAGIRSYPESVLSPSNRIALRNEAIASLALIDLQPGSVPESDQNPSRSVLLAADLEIYGRSSEAGDLQLFDGNSGGALGDLPGPGSRAVRMLVSPGRRLVAVGYAGGKGPRTVVWDLQTHQMVFPGDDPIFDEAADFSADDRRFALGTTNGQVKVYTFGKEGMTKTDWNLSEYTDLLNRRIARTIQFYPDPSTNLLAESSGDHYINLWNSETGQREGDGMYFPSAVRSFSWHPRGRMIAAACTDKMVYLSRFPIPVDDSGSKRLPFSLQGHEESVECVAFSRYGNFLASLGADDTLRLWVLATGNLLTLPLTNHSRSISSVRFSAEDQKLVLTGSRNQYHESWKVLGGEYRVLGRPEFVDGESRNAFSGIHYLSFSPDSSLLAAGSDDSITIWASSTGRRLADIRTTNAWAAAFRNDVSQDARLLIASDSGLSGQQLRRPNDQLEIGPAVAYEKVRDGVGAFALATNGHAAIIRIDRILLVNLNQTNDNVIPKIQTTNHCRSIAVSPDGRWIAARSARSDAVDGLNLWDATTGQPIQCDIRSSAHFAFSPDQRWLVASTQGALQFYDVGSWQEDTRLRTPRESFSASQPAPFAFSPAGRLLAVAHSRASIRIYTLPTPDGQDSGLKHLATLESPNPGSLLHLAFSPDGIRLAAAMQDHSVQLWDLARIAEGLERLGLGDRDFPQRTLVQR